MGKPIEIKLDADTGGAEKGIGRVADSLGDVEDALDKVERPAWGTAEALRDVGDAGKAGARDAVRGLDDVADAAKTTAREGADLDRDLTKALENVKTQAKDTSEGVEDAARGMKEAFERNEITAQDIFKESLRAELVSNMTEAGAETIRGFKDGIGTEDFETIIDGITDTMVAVGALGGPVGVAAGLAGGAVVQMFAGPLLADAEAKAEQFQATFADAFSNIVESGANLGRELSIAASVDEFAQDMDKMNTATDAANALGIERGVVLRAMAGDTDALNIVTEKNTEAVAAGSDVIGRYWEQITNNGVATEELTAAYEAATAQGDALGSSVGAVTDSYDTNTGALNAATDAASAKAEADNYAAEKALANAAAMATSTGAAQNLEVKIDGVTRAFQVMPDGKTVEVTDGGSAERTQEEIDAISGGYVTITGTADQGQMQREVNAAGARLMPIRVQVLGVFGTKAV